MRYATQALHEFAHDLLISAGLERDMAAVVAEVLLEPWSERLSVPMPRPLTT
jgi:hypothetical protein